MDKITQFSDLLGKTCSRVEQDYSDEIVFTLDDGRRFKLYHSQDCCESVSIEDVEGDLSDLVGSPLTMAEETSNRDNPKEEWEESFTWTYYRLATVKGYVTIRWYGSSNGYYSEAVDFKEIEA